MATKDSKKGEPAETTPSEKRDQAAVDADKKPSPHRAGDGAATGLDQHAKRLHNMATAAVLLSIVAVVVALTGPIWAPKLYGDSVSARVFVLSVAQLRPALESDAPFGLQLATLRGIVSEDAEMRKSLEAIASFSETGVPTVPQLRTSFSRLANEILLREIVDPKRSWFDRLMLSTAATLELHALVRKMETKDPSAQSIMEAHVALHSSDLAGAIAALGKLSGRPAELAKPWIQAANARLAASRVLKLLDTLATTRLSRNRSLFMASN